MEDGGWGLFYNYVHHPYEEFSVDGSELPINPKSAKSHVNLADIGFEGL